MQDDEIRHCCSYLDMFQAIYDFIEQVRVGIRRIFFRFEVPKYYYKRKLERR